MMKPLGVAVLVALVVGCHLDKLVNGSGGGSPPPSHGTAVGLAFMSQPQTAQAGSPIGSVKVSVVDSAGHPVAGEDTATVVMRLGDNPGSATLHGDTTAHPVNGVATFANLWLDNAGNNYTLDARAGTLSTKSAPFDITAPPPTTGTLNVTTNTTANPPASGYTVAVTGAASQSIGASATVPFPGLSAGSHTVTLSNVPSNCTVTPGTSQTVTITAGQTQTATFTITCLPPPTTGDITVTTTTSGPSQPSGYSVAVDGGSTQSIPASGSYTFASVPAGSHTVTLSDVPANCTVSPGASQNATVPAGGQVTAPFTISCTAPPPPVDHPPVVNAGGNQTVLVGSFTVNASFTDQDNDGPWSYVIDWGDGSSTSGSAPSQGGISASHSYGSVSTNTLRVTVTDAHNLSGSDTAVISVVLSLP